MSTRSSDRVCQNSILDEIDRILARHYGFTDEELDFIINYDIKYRMGDELEQRMKANKRMGSERYPFIRWYP